MQSNVEIVSEGMATPQEFEVLFRRLMRGAVFEERARPFRFVVTDAGTYRVNGVKVFMQGGEELEGETPLKVERLR